MWHTCGGLFVNGSNLRATSPYFGRFRTHIMMVNKITMREPKQYKFSYYYVLEPSHFLLLYYLSPHIFFNYILYTLYYTLLYYFYYLIHIILIHYIIITSLLLLNYNITTILHQFHHSTCIYSLFS